MSKLTGLAVSIPLRLTFAKYNLAREIVARRELQPFRAPLSFCLTIH